MMPVGFPIHRFKPMAMLGRQRPGASPRWGRTILLIALFCLLATGLSACSTTPAGGSPRLTVALDGTRPGLDVGVSGNQDPQGIAVALQLVAALTVLSLAPALLVMVTSFTRIVVVLGFIRTALGVPQMPPNQVLLGLGLFLSLFVMMPTLEAINTDALEPYMDGRIEQTEALDRAARPLHAFMMRQTREKDLSLFVDLGKMERPNSPSDVPLHVLIPAFVISELKTAFQMGFVIFIPFLVIDMVVSSSLMSMGMMMLPPAMVSLPFKLLLFVMVDGWYLVVGSLMKSFG